MTADHPLPAAADVVDACVPMAPGQRTHAVRRGPAKVVVATQASHDGLFSPAVAGLSVAERLAAALLACALSKAPALAQHYRRLLLAHGALAAASAAAIDAGQWQAVQPARPVTVLGDTHKPTQRPIDGDREAVQALVRAGLSTPAIVALAQLIAFVSYQVRLVAGLQAMVAAEACPAAPPQQRPATPTAAPVLLPSPRRINGFTDDIPPWGPWLDTVDVSQATPAQLAALDEMSLTARQSPYFLLLAHPPEILLHRSVAFNAIMFAPGGLSRAERELGAAVESRLNGCVHCTAVHAHRFTQLTRCNDVIAQLFQQPAGAGSDARELAVVQFSAGLGLQPQDVAAADVAALSAVWLAPVELLDLCMPCPFFAWANRLMRNLGEAVLPSHALGS